MKASETTEGALPPFPSRALLDVLVDPVIASDGGGAILYVNPAAERLLGWNRAELVGRPLSAIMPARLRAAHAAGFGRFMSTGESRIMGRPIRVPALHRSGSEIEVELTLSQLPGQAGKTLVLAVLRDLRERIELERKLASHRNIVAQYAAVAVLTEAPSAAVAIPKVLETTARALEWDVGIYWAANPDSGRLGVAATWSSGNEGPRRFLDGCRPITFGPGEGLPGVVFSSGRAAWSKDVRTDDRYRRASLAAAHGLRSALLFPVYCSNRTWGVLEYLSVHENEPDQELSQSMAVLGFQLGQFLERLENEEELRRAWAEADAERRNLRHLFEDAPAAIAIVRGPEMRYELSNAVNQQLAGGRELVGKTVREALPGLEADGVTAVIGRVYETGEPFVAREYPVTLPAALDRPARPIFMNGICQPLRGAGGAVDGVMIFAYDVTDLVLSRERVKDAEERLRLAVEGAGVGTWDYDPKTGAVRADARYRRLFGLGTDGEVNAATFMGAIHPDDRKRVTEAAQRSFDPTLGGEYAVDYRTRGIEDGLERWLAVRGRTMFDGQGRPNRFVGTGVDITQERRALDRLRFLSEASTILSSSLDYRATLAEVATLAVPQLADWCVVEVGIEEGATEQVAVVHIDPAKVELARELRRRYPPESSSTSGILQVLATGKPQLVPEVTDQLLVAAARDDQHLGILRGVGLRSAMLLPLTIRDRPIAVLGLFQAESGRRYTQEDLSYAQELARRAAIAIENARLYDEATRAIGIRDQFLSIASHELRTPLTSLMLQLSGLSRLVKAGTIRDIPVDKLGGRITRMEQQATRLTTLVDELLNVSRISTGRLALNPEPVDLVAIVREVVERLTDEAENVGCAISVDAPASVTGTWDRNRVDQVITNLLANATKYARGKPIHVKVGQDRESATVTVRDQGPGISRADQQRIFGQFERAAPEAMAGLGLGLWIASKIVEAHGGRIEVASQIGDGAAFTVVLPRKRKSGW